MEKWNKYLNYNQPNCIMFYNETDINCWEMRGTLCFHDNLKAIKNTICKEFCENCSFIN